MIRMADTFMDDNFWTLLARHVNLGFKTIPNVCVCCFCAGNHHQATAGSPKWLTITSPLDVSSDLKPFGMRRRRSRVGHCTNRVGWYWVIVAGLISILSNYWVSWYWYWVCWSICLFRMFGVLDLWGVNMFFIHHLITNLAQNWILMLAVHHRNPKLLPLQWVQLA